MNRHRNFIGKIIILTVVFALVAAPSSRVEAKGKGFKDLVKYLETNFQAKKTHIPMLGLANFAIKLIRPAGVKGFKLAVYEDQDFLSLPHLSSFNTVMREAYSAEWMPMVQVNSKRDGGSRTFIYAKSKGKDVELAVVTFEEREAVVLEVKLNPEAAARFMDNPKIMGISLGKSIRGGGGVDPGTLASAGSPNRSPRRASTISSSGSQGSSSGRPVVIYRSSRRPTPVNAGAATPASDDPAVGSNTPGARPALNPADNDENNPPATAAAGEMKDSKEEAATAPPNKDAIRIETRLVNLNVKAIDRQGQPLTDLKPEDFTIYEDGIRQELSHFKPVNAPVNLILLLDLSGSTKKKRKAMGEAARNFIDALPREDKVAVVAFTRRYRQLTDFTSDKNVLKKSIKDIGDMSGGTAFYDSMWQALDQLGELTESRKAIVVLTDGEDESLIGHEETTHTFDELLDRTSEDDITIYPIYFSSRNHINKLGVLFGGGSLTGNPDARTAFKQLEDLAGQTGGEVFSAQHEAELESAYQRVARELHTLYSLAYSPDKLKHNGEFRRVSVKISREGSIARTRKGYFDR